MFKSFLLTFFLAGTAVCSAEYNPRSIPYPSYFPLLERKGYSLVYDGRNKIPLWTQTHLTRENVSGRIDTRPSFREDDAIYDLHKSTNEDYEHSGFQRGHMVPDADRDNTMDILKETYLYSNACPQLGAFNGAIWARLEQHIRDLVMEYGYDSVDVITGPLFLPHEEEDGKRYVKYQVIGDNDVAVPTHFFKVVHANYDSNVDTWVYILPAHGQGSDDLNDYIESMDKIEKASGLIFNHFDENH